MKFMQTLLKVTRSFTLCATPPANAVESIDFVYVPIRSFAAVVNFMLGAEREVPSSTPEHHQTREATAADRSLWGAQLPLGPILLARAFHYVPSRSGPRSIAFRSKDSILEGETDRSAIEDPLYFCNAWI